MVTLPPTLYWTSSLHPVDYMIIRMLALYPLMMLAVVSVCGIKTMPQSLCCMLIYASWISEINAISFIRGS